MSRDPYIDVESVSSARLLPAESGLHTHSEVEQTLSATPTLLASYERIASTSSSTSLCGLRGAGRAARDARLLEADLEDLDEECPGGGVYGRQVGDRAGRGIEEKRVCGAGQKGGSGA